MCPVPPVWSEGLTDAQVQPPSTRLRLAVDEQAVDRRQLHADVGPDDADGRRVADARACARPQAVDGRIETPAPDIARVNERDRAQRPTDRHPQLERSV